MSDFFPRRYTSVNVASAQEPSIRSNVSRGLHGVNDSLWLRRVPAQVPRDTI